ncbi:uncharacterized protein LOC112569023 [Pomacea canaliculata]|uniref:uncharacterized protein LOC112569023 n=1 Tax=Pomacea canaliculata TaxID=400727 RepID=UPI000D731D37|nr:uncharacterized protein LOC112569023 [Pomacea canaliculata]
MPSHTGYQMPGPTADSAGPVPLLFSMNVSRQDDGARLTWRGAWRGASARTFVINVTYSTEIVSLTFDHEPSAVTATVDQSSSVGLNCVWNHGNPPQTVRLLDRRRQVMKTSDLYSTVNYLKHTWQSVTCDDAGVVTCEDGVADVNKSVRLLVRCKPEFLTDRKHQNFSINKRNQATRLYFRARTHSLLIADCQMKKLQSASDTTSSFSRERTPSRVLGPESSLT